jgi:hypothetical protein
VADVTLEEIARRLKVAIGPLPNKLARGGIIGIAEIVDCVAAHTSPEGPFGFVLRNARKLSFHPMPGRLSLFDISPNLLDP